MERLGINMVKNSYQTGRMERLSYAGFFLGQNIIYIIPLQLLTYFYTEYAGLSLVDTTILLLLAKVWDAVNDPIMGAIVDKCNFKKGKYLPWLKFATYALPASMFFLFVNIEGPYLLKLFYAYISYIVFDIVYTISDSPLFSLSTVMTGNTYERDKLIAFGRLAAAVAAVASAVVFSIKDNFGWTWTAGIYCLTAFIVMLPLQFTAKERMNYQRNEEITFVKIFTYLFKNKYLLIYFTGYLAIEITNTLQIMAAYFASSNLGDEGFYMVIMAVAILPVIIIAPFLPRLIQKFGKKRLTVSCSLATIFLCIVQYLSGYENLEVFLIIASARVLFMQVPLMLYGMFTADCIEYGAFVNGERTEGIAFALQTFVTKLGGAFCNTLCLFLLGVYGYIENADEKMVKQSVQALHGIWVIMSLIPIGGYLIMVFIMSIYRLDEKKVAVMMNENHKKIKVE
jgi:glycoside/pentoside/hexuronide:cation symporter, GPH family